MSHAAGEGHPCGAAVAAQVPGTPMNRKAAGLQRKNRLSVRNTEGHAALGGETKVAMPNNSHL